MLKENLDFEQFPLGCAEIQIKYWCVYYQRVLCGMGKSQEEAYVMARATLSAIGVEKSQKNSLTNYEDNEKP